MADWPIYEKNLLIVGNPESQIGICTLWSKKEEVANKLDPAMFCAVGNLYSASRGLDVMFRNILAKPSLRYLIVCGSDSSESGQAVLDFFHQGFERGENDLGQECWRVRSKVKGIIDIEVSQDALNELRKSIIVMDCRGLVDLRVKLEGRSYPELQPFLPEPAIFPKPEPQANVFPSEEAGHIIRGNFVAEVYLQMLDEILRFGSGGSSHYQDHLEIPVLVTVIEQEDPDEPRLYPWLPVTRQDIERYFVQVLGSDPPDPGVRYVYGHRIHAYFGYDQEKTLIEKLKKDPDSKSGVIGIWDPLTDLVTGKSPCINKLWFKIVRGKLFLNTVIRSNDMYEAWLGNVFSLRKLQKRVASEVCNGQMGALTVVSESAHLYKPTWEPARLMIEQHWKKVVPDPRLVQDPRGSWLIRVDREKKEIVAEHLSPDNDSLQVVRGRSAQAIYLQIARKKGVLLAEHALYLGAQLEKAYTALQLGLEYVQDKPLKFFEK